MTAYLCSGPSTADDAWLSAEWDGPPDPIGVLLTAHGRETHALIDSGQLDKVPFPVWWRATDGGTRWGDMLWTQGGAKIVSRRLVHVLQDLRATGYRTFEIDLRDHDGRPVDGYVGIDAVPTDSPADLGHIHAWAASAMLVSQRVHDAFAHAGLVLDAAPFDPWRDAVALPVAAELRPELLAKLGARPLLLGEPQPVAGTSEQTLPAARDWGSLTARLESLVARIRATPWPRTADDFPAWAAPLGLRTQGAPDEYLDEHLVGTTSFRSEHLGCDLGWHVFGDRFLGISLLAVANAADATASELAGLAERLDGDDIGSSPPQAARETPRPLDGPQLDPGLAVEAPGSTGEIEVRAWWVPPGALLPGGRITNGLFHLLVQDSQLAMESLFAGL